MKNLPHTSKYRSDFLNAFQHASTVSKGMFILTGAFLLILTGVLLYSIFPVLSQILDQALNTDYSASIMQSGR
ncbi:MAG: hypothetical protein AAF694_04530 [Bacteroidota bacterium]